MISNILIWVRAQRAKNAVIKKYRAEYRLIQNAARRSSLAGKPAQDIFLALGSAVEAMCLTLKSRTLVFVTVSQMIRSVRVSSELLRMQLAEHLPGAYQLAAQALDLTPQELTEKLSAGEILAEEFLPAFARKLQEKFGHG